MSYLLFMDESGHDHKNMPYEVRGGIAIHTKKLWPFIEVLKESELNAFGCELKEFKKEMKGCKLLDKDRLRWAAQMPEFPDLVRHKHVRAFLNKGQQKLTPTMQEFTAYGQACLKMARSIFRILRDFEVVLFASAIPKGANKLAGTPEEYLRKDQVFLFERYFSFLEEKQQAGLIIMDETEKQADSKSVTRLQNYFSKTKNGRYRTTWIVPVPMFVASDMTQAIQIADVCTYCINWTFRVKYNGMDATVRKDIEEFSSWLGYLQYKGHKTAEDGNTYLLYGIVYVEDL